MRLHRPAPVEDRPLVLEDVPVPTPRPTEIVIRVHACAICRTDLHQVEGELLMRRTPVIPGHQVVGTVEARGDAAHRFAEGDRVGVAWLHQACGECPFCVQGRNRENLCENAQFTGWSVDGGYAEYISVPQDFAYQVPSAFHDIQAAPMLCAGIIGYRALRLSGVQAGQRLGLFGFGASAHLAIQIARHRGCEVFVFTRSEANRELARHLGAEWVGGSKDRPPATMHGSIIFAPAGSLVLDALETLEKGGTVALASIHMSAVPPMDYRRHLYDEKVLRSVANATRCDGEEFLTVAAEIPVEVSTRQYGLDDANEGLRALKHGEIQGAAVLTCN